MRLLFLIKKIEINIINNSTLFVEGNLIFKGDNNQFTKVISSDKSGSIIFNNNKYMSPLKKFPKYFV